MMLLLLLAQAAPAAAPVRPPPALFEKAIEGAEIEQIALAPIFHQVFNCTEHPSGQLSLTGDALGTDCAVAGGKLDREGGFLSGYRGDGARNEDWYGWGAEVHAPIAGRVTFLHRNPVTNIPGTMGRPPASMIVIAAASGINVVLAHIDQPRVKVGDTVTAGQVIAQVGNNGMSRAPHIHVGAYRGNTPLQIRWDLRALGQVPALSGN